MYLCQLNRQQDDSSTFVIFEHSMCEQSMSSKLLEPGNSSLNDWMTDLCISYSDSCWNNARALVHRDRGKKPSQHHWWPHCSVAPAWRKFIKIWCEEKSTSTRCVNFIAVRKEYRIVCALLRRYYCENLYPCRPRWRCCAFSARWATEAAGSQSCMYSVDRGVCSNIGLKASKSTEWLISESPYSDSCWNNARALAHRDRGKKTVTAPWVTTLLCSACVKKIYPGLMWRKQHLPVAQLQCVCWCLSRSTKHNKSRPPKILRASGHRQFPAAMSFKSLIAAFQSLLNCVW